MKKTKLFICVAMLCLVACKEKESTTPDNSQLTPIQSILDKNAPAVQKFTFNNESGTVITGVKGTQISIAPNTYGSAAGQVTISLKEVYNKKEMAAAGIFTNASGNRMLSSLGMFEVKATRNGVEVQPEKDAQVKMNIPGGTTPQNTKVFKLVKVLDSFAGVIREEWVEYDENWDYDSTKKCQFNFKCISWCNLDAYVDWSVSNNIRVTPPAGFGSNNMQVYFNMTGVNGLAMLYPNIVTKTFNTYALKSGISGTIVMVAVKDNKYYKKVLDVTFTANEQPITVQAMEEISLNKMELLLGSF